MQLRYLDGYLCLWDPCFPSVLLRDHDLALRPGRYPTRRLANPVRYQPRRPHLEPVEGPERELAGAFVREPRRRHHELQRGPQGVLRLHRPEPGCLVVTGESCFSEIFSANESGSDTDV